MGRSRVLLRSDGRPFFSKVAEGRLAGNSEANGKTFNLILSCHRGNTEYVSEIIGGDCPTLIDVKKQTQK